VGAVVFVAGPCAGDLTVGAEGEPLSESIPWTGNGSVSMMSSKAVSTQV
jgi:hypothetical protein